MNQSLEKVLSYLAGNENMEAVTIDELQKLEAENPYFPVYHLLLAKKLKGENDLLYSLNAQKTALYFSNPYWLQYLLAETNDSEETSLATTAKGLGEDKIGDLPVNPGPPAVQEPEPFITLPDDKSIIPTDRITKPIASKVDQGTTAVENKIETPVQKGGLGSIQPENIQAEEDLGVTTRDTDAASAVFITHLDTTTTPGSPDSALPDDLSPAGKTQVVELEEEMAGVTHRFEKTTQHFLDDLETKPQKKPQPEEDEHDRMFQNIKAMLDASSDEADADPDQTIVHIDPYFTIDYFASQGIKLELDKQPQDQLGQNLKKFTQWLRHMKKLGPEDATEVISRTDSDADIQQIADTSNTVREVVTEAMALVLEKQGKKDKAVELYNKLSFLNPHKSAYFADKIKKLKGS